MRRRAQVTFTRLHGGLYRLLRGRLPGSGSMLLLTTTGRKSGRARTVPLLYVRDGKRYAIIASNGGADASPTWWLNLQTAPTAMIVIRGRQHRVIARQADESERAQLWPAFTKIYGRYEAYAHKTRRRIPIVLLDPA